jgi:hypothetical protein
MLELERLFQRLQDGAGLVLGHVLAAEGRVAIDDLLHLRFDGAQVFLRERAVRAAVVVVEAVLDGGAEGHLGARKQALHRVGHDVGAAVPNDAERRVLMGLDGGQLGVRSRERSVQVEDLAIDHGRHGLLGELLAGCEHFACCSRHLCALSRGRPVLIALGACTARRRS